MAFVSCYGQIRPSAIGPAAGANHLRYRHLPWAMMLIPECLSPYIIASNLYTAQEAQAAEAILLRQ